MTNRQLTHDFFHSDKRSKRLNSMSYSGDNFYSYSTLIAVKDDSKRVLFICKKGYSNTTRKHKNHLRSSSPYSVIEIQDVYDIKSSENHDLFSLRFSDAKNRLFNPRCKNKEYDINTIETNRSNYKYYLIKIDSPETSLLSEMNQFLKDIKNNDFVNVQTEKFKELLKKEQEKKRLKLIQDVKDWRNFEKPYINSEFQLLRVKNDIIQTSKGYELTVNEFKRLYTIFKRNKEDLYNEKVNRSISIDHINDGKMTIGCHKITFEEIELMYSTIK